MRVGLDVRPLGGATGARGVGRYIRELIATLEQTEPKLELVRFERQRNAVGPDFIWGRLLGPSWLRALDIDLWQATFLAPPRVPRDLPWVSTIHDLIPLRFPKHFPWKNRLVFARSLAWSSKADRVVAVSPFTADRIRERFPACRERVVVIPPSVALEWRDAQQPGIAGVDRPYLISLGGFDPLKGVEDLLLPAFQRLAQERPELQLVLTGAPSAWRDRIERKLVGSALHGRVIFPGLLAPNAHAAAIAGARAVVVSSREEGFGLPAIEGLALGVAVAVGPAHATREAVGRAGHLARGDSWPDLADAIREALEAGGPDSADGAARREQAHRYHPSVIGPQWIELYRELTHHARSATR
jgi:glycosyltransferase involved in cell wall biosynthesis